MQAEWEEHLDKLQVLDSEGFQESKSVFPIDKPAQASAPSQLLGPSSPPQMMDIAMPTENDFDYLHLIISMQALCVEHFALGEWSRECKPTSGRQFASCTKIKGPVLSLMYLWLGAAGICALGTQILLTRASRQLAHAILLENVATDG